MQIQFQDWGTCVTPEGVATINCVTVVFQNLILALLLFAGIVAIFLVIHSGFKFVLAGGDPKKVEDARSTLVFAILGLVIVFFAFLILNIVAFVTGVNCIVNFGFACV